MTSFQPTHPVVNSIWLAQNILLEVQPSYLENNIIIPKCNVTQRYKNQDHEDMKLRAKKVKGVQLSTKVW